MTEEIKLYTAQCCGRCTQCTEEGLGLDKDSPKYFYCKRTSLGVQEHYYCRHFIDFVTKTHDRHRVPESQMHQWGQLKKTYAFAERHRKEIEE